MAEEEKRKFTEEEKNKFKLYFELDDEIRDLKATMKEKTAESKALLDEIKHILEETEHASINTNRGGLIKKTKIKRGGINRKYLIDSLKECELVEESPEIVEQIVQYVYNNRPEEQIEIVERIK